ncbi:uncharacterized protein LOC143835268 isoform X2 [Paroedura picta]|uniref:uncharacterized protein LOC143835268 isoform X2 n=1 Tax=Paroedura picta TaxID=143630 RepID=UPI004056909D
MLKACKREVLYQEFRREAPLAASVRSQQKLAAADQPAAATSPPPTSPPPPPTTSLLENYLRTGEGTVRSLTHLHSKA